ncbi:ATP-binding protein [Virgibacillus sp. 6R]|uniref:sensor histidine kinase n=1 Tax=Metabacillus sp. 22489 TaxID=3453928 RepID=UPI0011A26449
MRDLVGNMTFRLKIITVLLFITLLYSSFGLILVHSIEDITKVSNNIQEENIPELLWLSKFSEELSIREHIVTSSIKSNSCCTFIAEYQAYVADVKEETEGEELPSSLKKIKSEIDLLDFDLDDRVGGLLNVNDHASAEDYIKTEFLPKLDQLQDKIIVEKNKSIGNLNRKSSSFSEIIKGSLWLLICLSIGAVFFSIIVSYRMSANITKPIENMISKVDKIAKGHYGMSLGSINDQIELRQLTNSINTMSSRLKDSFNTILNDKNYREQILNSLSVGIITLNDQKRDITLNNTAKHLLNLDEEQVKTFLFTKAEGENQEFWEIVAAKESYKHTKVTFQANDERRILLVSQVGLVDQKQDTIGRVINFIDITETEELEKRMHQSEKLALVGEMAADAAHEIRNPLAVVHGFLSLMNQSLSESNKDQFHLPLIMKEIERINVIIEEMLLTSKPGAPITKEVYIEEIIKEFLPLIVESSEDIHFSIQLNQTPVNVDVKQIKQVFHNMIRNSIEAMGGKGKISITSQVDDNFYKIYMMDNGPGIPEQVRETMFEPFSTSKENGTGLGLVIVKRIIENHQGSIKLLNSTEEGTTFQISIPIK